jgi:hypothetical protein
MQECVRLCFSMKIFLIFNISILNSFKNLLKRIKLMFFLKKIT